MKPLKLALADRKDTLLIERLVKAHRHHQSIDAGRSLPRDLEQVVPLDRIGNVVAVRVASLREVVGRADDHEALGPGEALELDAGLAAHRAARTVRADQVAAADVL